MRTRKSMPKRSDLFVTFVVNVLLMCVVLLIINKLTLKRKQMFLVFLESVHKKRLSKWTCVFFRQSGIFFYMMVLFQCRVHNHVLKM